MDCISEGKIGGHDFVDHAVVSLAEFAFVEYTNNKTRWLRSNGAGLSQLVAICSETGVCFLHRTYIYRLGCLQADCLHQLRKTVPRWKSMSIPV